MKRYFFIIALLIFSAQLFSQQAISDTIYSKVTTKQAKEQRYKYLVDTTIKQYLAEPLNDDNEGDWNEALWSLELLQYKDDYTKQKLASRVEQCCTTFRLFSKKFIRDNVFII